MTINFYSHHAEYGCFSNFSNHPVELKGKAWSTSEHYFQAQKFAGTKYESQVRKCQGPGEAAAMGRDRSLPLRADWEQVKDNVMRAAVLAKFLQNEEAQDELLSTGDEKLVEHTKNDKYWADGGNGTGKNMLGIILMEVREVIKNAMAFPSSLDESIILEYVKKHNLEWETE